MILLIADGYVCRGELRSPAWNFVESNGRPMVAPTDYEENFLFSIIKFWYWICVKLRLNQWADILQIAGGSLPLAPTDYEENFLFSIIKFWYWICIKLRLNQWADILQIAGGSLPLAPAK